MLFSLFSSYQIKKYAFLKNLLNCFQDSSYHCFGTYVAPQIKRKYFTENVIQIYKTLYSVQARFYFRKVCVLDSTCFINFLKSLYWLHTWSIGSRRKYYQFIYRIKYACQLNLSHCMELVPCSLQYTK